MLVPLGAIILLVVFIGTTPVVLSGSIVLVLNILVITMLVMSGSNILVPFGTS